MNSGRVRIMKRKKTKLCWKVLTVIGIILVLLLVLAYFISSTILMDSFIKLDQQNVHRNVKIAEEAVSNELEGK
jgi:sensor domain CHASE-containing protein